METTVPGSIPTSSAGVSNYTEGTLNKASSSAHAAVNSIASAADQAASKAKPAIDHVASMAHQAVDRVAGAAAPAADWLTEQGEHLTAAQKQMIADVSNYISANPLKSVAIAVATGFLLSRIVR